MATGYAARMHRAGMSRDLHRPDPLPTKADFAAQIFDQSWASVSAHNSVTLFPVLALDAAHARELGERKLAEMYGPGAVAEMRLIANVPRPWFDVEALGVLLSVESPVDRNERQARFAAEEATHG